MIALLALAATVASPQEVRFSFSGPMASLLVEGKKPGMPTTGIPFAIVLADSGAKIEPSEFDLKTPGSDKTIKLTLAGAKFAGGHLTATAKVQDGQETAIEGVRLDVTGATESYKDAKGAVETRPEPVA
ncbi:MAG TPA: hypothetical protein VG820_06000, partial [Fimbriimonadaceae bacterium]|nr:hypothetical protein [Fimbriimonadaceae bacterium]